MTWEAIEEAPGPVGSAFSLRCFRIDPNIQPHEIAWMARLITGRKYRASHVLDGLRETMRRHDAARPAPLLMTNNPKMED